MATRTKKTLKTRDELGKLYQDNYHTGVGAEIGVQLGLNSKKIAEEWKGKILCVDNWNEQAIKELSESNLGGDQFKILQGLSVDIAKQIEDKSLDWVYIDADHEYQSVKDDIEAWFPKVREGGIISGHDYDKLIVLGGVVRAVDEFCEQNKYKFKLTGEKHCPSWYFQK
jgi:predicted O-methyltransferase YrrM